MEVDLPKQQTLAFLGTVLEPVIRLLLRAGVTWKEFAEVAKLKFVEVASADFGIKGRPTNASRVAILTGLDRREVGKLRSAPPDPASKGYQSKASQILAAWHQDADFLEADGRPALLATEGPGRTFAELVRRYAPALPFVAVLKELKTAGAVEALGDGRLRVLTRAYVPRGVSPERLRLWSSVLADLANTIEHNLSRDSTTAPRFERRAVNLDIARSALPEFRQLLETEGQAFLERIDDWLTAHQVGSAVGDEGIRLGVGLYHIQDRTPRRAHAPRSNNKIRGSAT